MNNLKTEDILKYHFGDNLDAVKESGDLYILTQSSGYDIIVYNGQLLGYGATESITSNNITKDSLNLLKDIATENTKTMLQDYKESMSSHRKIQREPHKRGE